jgi:hypothetical protein
MIKCLILLMFSFANMASNFPEDSSEKVNPFNDNDKFNDFVLAIKKRPLGLSDITNLRKNVLPKTSPITKSKTHKKINLPIRQTIIAHESDSVKYQDINPEIIVSSINALKTIEETNSATISQAIHSDKSLDDAYTNIKNSKFYKFLPLFKEAIELIKNKEIQNGRIPMHLAIRIDPNCHEIENDSQRRFTQEWHRHSGVDRYLFALTEEDNLTTMVNYNGQEEYIEKNRLFFLPGEMLHRTPDSAPGVRIQFSISVEEKIWL